MQAIKLHIGCADNRLEGHINIDCRPTKATDLVAPAWDIPQIEAGSVACIYSRHMLEHLDPDDARQALRHWLVLLQRGGRLNVIVPDIEFHARQLLGLASSKLLDQKRHAFAGFWGWRDVARGGNKEDAHRWGYTYQTLARELERAGFSGINRVTQGVDAEPWHLNITAHKA